MPASASGIKTKKNKEKEIPIKYSSSYAVKKRTKGPSGRSKPSLDFVRNLSLNQSVTSDDNVTNSSVCNEEIKNSSKSPKQIPVKSFSMFNDKKEYNLMNNRGKDEKPSPGHQNAVDLIENKNALLNECNNGEENETFKEKMNRVGSSITSKHLVAPQSGGKPVPPPKHGPHSNNTNKDQLKGTTTVTTNPKHNICSTNGGCGDGDGHCVGIASGKIKLTKSQSLCVESTSKTSSVNPDNGAKKQDANKKILPKLTTTDETTSVPKDKKNNAKLKLMQQKEEEKQKKKALKEDEKLRKEKAKDDEKKKKQELKDAEKLRKKEKSTKGISRKGTPTQPPGKCAVVTDTTNTIQNSAVNDNQKATLDQSAKECEGSAAVIDTNNNAQTPSDVDNQKATLEQSAKECECSIAVIDASNNAQTPADVDNQKATLDQSAKECECSIAVIDASNNNNDQNPADNNGTTTMEQSAKECEGSAADIDASNNNDDQNPADNNGTTTLEQSPKKCAAADIDASNNNAKTPTNHRRE